MCRDTSAGWSAHLNSLELSVVLDSTADAEKNFSQSHAHRYFYEAALLDLSCECEYFRTLGSFCSELAERSAAVEDDPRNVSECFYVVDIRRFLPEALSCRERWFQSRHASFTFEGCDQSCFFTAYECACTCLDIDIKVKSASENVFAEVSSFSCLSHCNFKSLDCKRILSTAVDNALGCSHCISADDHAFD